MADEWKKPKNPPPPLFLGKKERDLVKQVNDELIEKVIGQQILYYPIDMQTANLIVTIHKAYDKNKPLQKKFEKIPLKQMKELVLRYLS